MNNRFLAIPFLLICTLADITISEGVFQQGNVWRLFPLYQLRMGLLSIAAIILFSYAARSVWLGIYSTVLLYCGWLDILYSWLQLKPLYPSYPWLTFPWRWLGFSPDGKMLLLHALSCLVVTILVDRYWKKVLVIRKWWKLKV